MFSNRELLMYRDILKFQVTIPQLYDINVGS